MRLSLTRCLNNYLKLKMKNNKEQENRKDLKLPLFMTTAMITLLFIAGGLLTSSEGRVGIIPSEAPTPSVSYSGLEKNVTPASPDAILTQVQQTPMPYAAPFIDGEGKWHD